MARMYPQQLPSNIKSDAEELLFNLFKEQLSDDYTVLYSVAWLMRDRRRFDQDGEIDFLIIHKDMGLLILEVKGGFIEIDDQKGEWYSTNKNGKKFLIKNPFEQAKRNLHNLQEKINEIPTTRAFVYRRQRAVAFPDMNVGNTNVGLYGDRDLIIDSTNLQDLDKTLKRVMGIPENRYPLTREAINALVNVLKPTMQLGRKGLGSELYKSEINIATLTESQFSLLNFLARKPKAAISGCAGSGKTMIAIEKVRRLTNEGFFVLFTCYNKNLASWVRELLQRDPFTPNDRVHVNHFHELAKEFSQTAGVELPNISNTVDEKTIQRYFEDVLPEKFQEAVNKVSLRFDAIIVDEGQDFGELWWVPLLDLLRDRDRGVFYIFYDDNQRIYSRFQTLPFDEEPFTLDTNCRNTNKIHQKVLTYYSGDPQPRTLGPEGIEPEIFSLDEKGLVETLRQIFAKLFIDEGLPIKDSVILTPLSQAKSELKEGTKIGNISLTWDQKPSPMNIRVSSIHSFKGLESSIVILTEANKIKDVPSKDYLFYIALSRARSHLVIIGDLPAPFQEISKMNFADSWNAGEF